MDLSSRPQKPARVERSRDTLLASAMRMGISTSGFSRKFILSACKAAEGLDANGLVGVHLQLSA